MEHEWTNEVKLERIIKIVLEKVQVSRDMVFSKTRKREAVTARHLCQYFMRMYTSYTLKYIGRLFMRDHTSVIHAIEHIEDLTATDPQVRKIVTYMDGFFESIGSSKRKVKLYK
jgi:chromosomal replication initiator protein